MKRLKHLTFYLAWLLQGIFAVSGVAACEGSSQNQPALSQSAIEVTYHDVVDILFPCEASGEYYLILRFLPSWTTESQLVISRNERGTYDVDYYFLPAGSKRIAEQIQAMRVQNIPNSPQEIASRIRVEHKRLRPAPPAVSDLMRAYFALRIPPRLPTKIIVDGTRYEFWFVTLSAQNVLHMSLDDYNSNGLVRNPVAAWMNRVKEAVDRASRDRRAGVWPTHSSPGQGIISGSRVPEGVARTAKPMKVKAGGPLF